MKFCALPFRKVPLLVGVDEEHLALPLRGLRAVQHADGHRNARAEEEVGRQANHRLKQVRLHNAPADDPLARRRRNSTPWGITTPTMPVALVTASMCNRNPMSPLVLGGMAP